ncbi:response regulator [Algoriphagus aestuarii]|nr:response regulator [Algoriphagus aestuarii]
MKQNYSILILGFVLIFCACSSPQLHSEFPKSLHQEAKILNLGQHQIDFDSISKGSLDKSFQDLPSANSNLGFTDSNYWVKFPIKNPSSEAKEYYLEVARPITDVANLYAIHPSGQIDILKSGDLIPAANRPFNHRKIIFPVTVEAFSELDNYLYLESDGEVINLPLVLHDANSLIQTSYFDQLVFGAFYGFLGLAGITYLFFYFGIKEKSFLLYSLYVASIALLHSSLDGFIYQFSNGSQDWLYDRSLLFIAATSSLIFGRYTQVFIRLKEISKKLNYVFQLALVLNLLLIFGILFLDAGRTFYYPAANAIGLILILLCLIGVIASFFTKYPVDLFFAAGITSLIIGFVIFILNNFSLIENSFLTENAAKIGTGFEILFLSLSMANRIRILKSEKEQMQAIALQQSEESNQIKSYFLSNMSHELRTPLNAIMGLSQSIMNEITDSKIRENLEVIKYSSVSLLSSIEDILDYSKIEKGELILDHKTFDLQKVIQEIKAFSYQKARDKGLKFIYEEEAPLPKRVIGDAGRFRQILGNILDNAIKFTPIGEVKLKFSEIIEKEGRINLTIEISDTGVGIETNKLSRIYESFIQQQLDDKRKFGGFGLGLCIVKALVKLFNGEIQIKSALGEGTQVLLHLDFEKVEKTESNLIELAKKDSESLLKGRHILVVEDNPVNQLVIKSMLRKWNGITMDFANHGLEALEKLQEAKFDLILMDLQMPEMDGYEATEAIRAGKGREIHREVPIIAVTADTTDQSKIRARAVGMDDFLTKPIDPEFLLEKALNALYLQQVQVIEINS